MKPIFYKPENGWVGDLIPFGHKDTFYLFYLHDERKGRTLDEYGYGTSWNLLITRDGSTIEDKGVVLPPGGYDDIDLSCYTGSVLEGPDGLFHLFYTAQNCDNPLFCRNGQPLQYIMHATSADLLHWDKHYERAFGADEAIYEAFDWRDPYVYYNEEEKCYNMLLAARQQGASQKRGGCIGLCQSKDLWEWTICEPFYNPETYLTHECPDLFRMGKWWYLVYSTFSDRFVTHYRMSRSPSSPWIAPVEDSFDARAFYAAKTAEANGERWAFAWVPSKRGNTDFGQWEWGGALVMHQLRSLPDGRLQVSLPPAIRNRFTQPLPLHTFQKEFDFQQPVLLRGEEQIAILPFCGLPHQFLLEADIAFSSGIRNFGVGIRQDEEYADGYFFRLEPFYNRIVFDLWPRCEKGVNQWYIGGDKPFVLELERPYRMDHLRTVHIALLVDGSICTLYVDNAAALTCRTYNTGPDRWSFFAFDGSIEVSNITLLKQSQSTES